MLAMAATLRKAVPELIDLSPKLAEALAEIEATIQTIGGINVARLTNTRRPQLTQRIVSSGQVNC
jgi:hypothetical protein